MPNPAFDQDAFAGVFDDGSETGSTLRTTNANWDEGLAIFRVRFVIQETAGNMGVNQQFIVRYNHNGGGYGTNTITTTSSVIRSVGSANTTWTLTDEDATTQQVGAGTFITGAWDDDGTAGEGNQLDFAGNDETEIEFCFQIQSVDVSASDTILLRVYNQDGSALGAYTNTPTITVDLPLEVNVSSAVTIGGHDYHQRGGFCLGCGCR
jgi:hypothetical protein